MDLVIHDAMNEHYRTRDAHRVAGRHADTILNHYVEAALSDALGSAFHNAWSYKRWDDEARALAKVIASHLASIDLNPKG